MIKELKEIPEPTLSERIMTAIIEPIISAREYFFETGNGWDLVSRFNEATRNIKLPWADYPGEIHIPGMNYIGPGTNLEERLNPDGTWKYSNEPANRVDEIALRHDRVYADERTTTAARSEADRLMIDELNAIPDPTMVERILRAIIIPILSVKLFFGV